ncbi:MAG: GTP-sensing pleiotropic transcriptional regulator CodY [Firmicutes bacterium]|jgi:transcriptional pleiotropic repressor|nr:GTP-sensing pleiotropic transcriptional regulator CodY [Bacillota bacterium]
MITSPILEKSRAIDRIIQETQDKNFDIAAIAEVLRKVIDASVLIVNRKGRILGYAFNDDFDSEESIRQIIDQGSIPEVYNDFLLDSNDLRDNLRQEPEQCAFLIGSNSRQADRIMTVMPLTGNGKRMGTLLLARVEKPFTADDVFLAEKCAGVLIMELMRDQMEQEEEEERFREVAQQAVGALSYCEMEAAQKIFSDFDGTEKILVAGKIADQLGITRSVIVNMLRKLKSAGIIESFSLGMKGTLIKVLNPFLIEHLRAKEPHHLKL